MTVVAMVVVKVVTRCLPIGQVHLVGVEQGLRGVVEAGVVLGQIQQRRQQLLRMTTSCGTSYRSPYSIRSGEWLCVVM